MATRNIVVDIRAMTDKQLKVFRNELLMEQSKISNEYSDEIASIATVNFDPNSYWGEKKINKIAKKYADKISGVDYLVELVIAEMGRRNMLNDQFGVADEDQSLEEFLESEETKTMAYRSDIDEE